jgi:predicted GNAT family acetyltransferase
MNLIGKKKTNKTAFEEAIKGKDTASQLYSAALAKAAEPSLVQQLADHLQTHKQPPNHSSHKQLYDAWRHLFAKKPCRKTAFEEAIKGKATASQLYSAALEKANAKAAKPSVVQQLATYLETNGKPPAWASYSNRQLYDAWNALLGKKQTNKKAFEEAIKGKDTASQLYSAALKKADAAKAKKGANAKSK